MEASRRPPVPPQLAGTLFIVLAILAGAALVVTQRLRQGEDIVNSVRIEETGEAPPGTVARVRLRLEEADREGSVEIVRGPDERVVDVLRPPAPMPAGRYRFRWDGESRADRPASPGAYRVRVVLDEQDREIVLPGRVRIDAGASDRIDRAEPQG